VVQRREVPSLAGSAALADPHPHALDALTGRELLALVDEEVARLPERYRLPVLLCVLQERPVEEAARLLGWSPGSLRGRLARGRERLRNCLMRRGLCLSVGTATLLTPAAVPEQLLAGAIRNLSAPAPAAVHALATGSMRLTAVGLGLLVLAALGLGAGWAFLRTPEQQTPSAAASAPSVPAREEPRRDRYSDPLPPGALVRLGTVRFRAPSEIVALALAADGKTVIAASHAGVFLFDAASGRRVRRLPMEHFLWGQGCLLKVSPDGKHLAGRGEVVAGNRSRYVVRVWDVSGEHEPRDYDATHVVALDWSAGGDPLALCLEPGVLHLRDLAAGRSRRFPCKNMPQPVSYVSAVCAWTEAGRTLAIADESGRVVHVWDTSTGRERCTIQTKGQNAYYSLAISPDGSGLISVTGQAVQRWDAATGALRYTVEARDRYHSPRFSPDGRLLAIAESWSTICFWDAATGRERGRTEGKHLFAFAPGFAPGFAFSPDGTLLFTVDHLSSAIHRWDVASGRRIAEPVGHTTRPFGSSFAPDGRRVATGGSSAGTVQVWDLVTGAPAYQIRRGGMARDVAFSPDGRWLFSAWADDNVWVSNARTGARRHVIKLEDPERPDTTQSAISMRLSDDGKTLVAVSYYYPRKNGGGPLEQARLVTGWDASTRRQLFRRRLPGMDSWMALSPDARTLALADTPASPRTIREMDGGGRGPMRLEDMATGEVLLTFPVLDGRTWPLTFSPDGQLLAAINSDWQRRGKAGDPAAATGYLLHLRETATGAGVLSLAASDGKNSWPRAAFSADGRFLALTPPAHEILVWDLARGRAWRRLRGFDADVTWLAFSPDGRRLLSGLTDSTLLVWDAGPHETTPPRKLGAEGVARAWTDLAGRDAARAFRARWALTSSPDEALALLKEHLHPARPADTARLRQLLADLDSKEFAVRDRAQADLEALGDLAEPVLRQSLANKPTLETRRRVQALLKQLRGPVTQPERIRALRAVAVLEDLATPAARQLLGQLAAGVPEARLTREAKASLGRLQREN
jgi:WD40 repeat protein